MRFLRFSIRRLLLLTGLIAVLLYFLFIRPVTAAKNFVYKVEHAGSTEITKYLDYVNTDMDGAHVECELNKRTWEDVFSFRQPFVISLVRRTGIPTQELVEKHVCIAAPCGVSQQEQYVYVEVREKRQ